MNDNCRNGGPDLRLLLIPAAVIIVKAAMHRRQMWASPWGPDDGGPGPGRDHHAGFGAGHHAGFGPGTQAEARPGFRLPPRFEWILDTWHTRAHQAAEAPDAATA
jgi:hypothetical protein